MSTEKKGDLPGSIDWRALSNVTTGERFEDLEEELAAERQARQGEEFREAFAKLVREFTPDPPKVFILRLADQKLRHFCAETDEIAIYFKLPEGARVRINYVNYEVLAESDSQAILVARVDALGELSPAPALTIPWLSVRELTILDPCDMTCYLRLDEGVDVQVNGTDYRTLAGATPTGLKLLPLDLETREPIPGSACVDIRWLAIHQLHIF
jgi:hypothetical protein